MNTLTDRLRAALVSHSVEFPESSSSFIRAVFTAINESRRVENARLAPIHEALVEVVEALEHIKRKYVGGVDAIEYAVLSNETACSQLEALEAALLKLEGK